MGAIAILAKALVGTSAGALFLGYLGIVKPLEYHGRYVVYILIVLASAVYGVVSSLAFAIIGKRGLAQWSTGRFFEWLLATSLHLKFDVIDRKILDSQRPAIFVTNHQSMLDIGVLGATFPRYCSVTAKKALKYYPLLGWFMWASGTVFINRGNRKTAIEAFNQAKADMKTTKQSVFMFPEGTRSHATDLTLLPFKKGAFHFAIQAQVPIVPYVVQNYSKVWYQREHRIKDSATIKIQVLDPIPTIGMTSDDAGKLMETCHNQMLAAYKKLGYALPDESK